MTLQDYMPVFTSMEKLLNNEYQNPSSISNDALVDKLNSLYKEIDNDGTMFEIRGDLGTTINMKVNVGEMDNIENTMGNLVKKLKEKDKKTRYVLNGSGQVFSIGFYEFSLDSGVLTTTHTYSNDSKEQKAVIVTIYKMIDMVKIYMQKPEEKITL